MPDFQFFDYLIVGSVATEFVVDLLNQSHQSILGGSALYAAGGLRCWKNRIAMVSKTSQRNKNGIQTIARQYQIDIDGVQFLANHNQDRIFYGYTSPDEVLHENPVGYFASKRISFPKDLLGYTRVESDNLRTRKSVFLPKDIPAHYWDANAALLCASDLDTQLQLSSMLFTKSTKKLIIQSSQQYMTMDHFETLPILMKDISAFVTTSVEMTQLFQNRSQDLWEMARYLCSLGCRQVVISDGRFGYYLYDSFSEKRYHIPVYPVKIIDPTGMQEAFCGGYLAGINNYLDPIEAILFGAVSASFNVQGTGPFFAADAMPDLLQTRLKFERELVKTL